MRKEPLFIDNLDKLRGARIPMIGKRTPVGFRRVSVRHEFGEDYGVGTTDGAYLFVDSSGFGSPGELAMTQKQFAEFIRDHPGYAYGVVEAGQFQVVVGVYQSA